MGSSSGDAKIPNAEYLAPFGKVTVNVSEGRRDKVHGLTSFLALIESNELLSIDVAFVEGFSACFTRGGVQLSPPSDHSMDCLGLRVAPFEGPLLTLPEAGARNTGGVFMSSVSQDNVGIKRFMPGLDVLTKGSRAPFCMPPFASACLALAFLVANFFGFRISSSHVSTVKGMPILTKDSSTHILSGCAGSYCEGARAFDGLTDRLRVSSADSDIFSPDRSASLS